jgi:thiamine pyrophosphate-dependent acetolactate synthase large subunit-like protein
VLTDLRVGAAFPTDHALHAAPPAIFPSAEAKAQLRDSDLIVSFDWVDLGGAIEDSGSSASITQVSLDYQIHRGWSMDYCSLPPVAHHIDAHPDRVFDAIAKSAGVDCRPHKYAAVEAKPLAFGPQQPENRLFVGDIATALMQSANRHPVSLLHLPISWEGRWWHFRHPLDYLGSDGGGGIGGGPGIAVGAALALRGTGRLPVAICGDGDFVMGATAIWTAVRYRIPLLVVVANNTSFFNDEVHQERMARARARPVENKWIGQRMADPEIDIAGLARAQGARAFGEVHDAQALVEALRDGIDIVNRGGVAVVDVRVSSGYPTGLETSLNKGKS